MRIKPLVGLAAGLVCSMAALADPQNSGNAFNPGIGLVLNGTWGSYPVAAGHRVMPGFMLGDNAGLAPQGFGLGESELALSSNFDNLFTGFGSISFHENHGQDSAEVELAYLQTIAMPYGLQFTAGKFFSSFGYQNSRHAHVWDFVDQPLVYEAMLNTQYSDPGRSSPGSRRPTPISCSAPRPSAATSFPAGGAAHSGNGANTVFVKASQDLDDSNTWFAGLSYMSARSFDRPSLGDPDPVFSDQSQLDGPFFTGTSNISWRRPRVEMVAPRQLLREELHLPVRVPAPQRVRHRVAHRMPGGYRLRGGSAYSGSANGWYVQGAYQWRPQWRFGLRYDRMNSDNTVTGAYQPPSSWPRLRAQARERDAGLLQLGVQPHPPAVQPRSFGPGLGQ